MTVKFTATQLIVLLLSLLIVGCSSVRTTNSGVIGIDRKQRMSSLVSASDLEKGASQAYAKILNEEKRKGTLNKDTRLTRRVRAISDRIIPTVGVFRSDALKWNWRVNVIQSDELNAWAMPGGKIAFYSGIINRLKLTDAEIAAIMGHEIAHALREHSRERASEQVATGSLIGGVGVIAGVGSSGTQLAQLAYNTTFGLKHSRSHETEADRIGVELAARAGYDPRAAIRVWQKMGRVSGGGGGPEFLSTHPSHSTRIKDLQVYSKKVLHLYKK